MKRVLLSLAISACAYAQTLTTPTLSRALTVDADSVQLSSCSGVTAGWSGFVDRELFRVREAIAGCNFRVQRGVGGIQSAHASGTSVYMGQANWFYRTDAAGTCDTNSPAPYINVTNGNIWNCTSSVYVPAVKGFTTSGNVTVQDLTVRHALATGTAPSITSGFGTSPSIAGYDDAGRITVGTGGSATTGVITFGTAYTTAPSCVANDETTTLLVKATATTTTLTLTSGSAWTAADELTWICRGY